MEGTVIYLSARTICDRECIASSILICGTQQPSQKATHVRTKQDLVTRPGRSHRNFSAKSYSPKFWLWLPTEPAVAFLSSTIGAASKITSAGRTFTYKTKRRDELSPSIWEPVSVVTTVPNSVPCAIHSASATVWRVSVCLQYRSCEADAPQPSSVSRTTPLLVLQAQKRRTSQSTIVTRALRVQILLITPCQNSSAA